MGTLSIEPLSRRERGRGEGSVTTGTIVAVPDPHPALRATFSRREKG
jgi:hypothetical protein